MGTKDRGCAGGYVKDLFYGKPFDFYFIVLGKGKGGGRETINGTLRDVSARRVTNTKTKSPSAGFKKRK